MKKPRHLLITVLTILIPIGASHSFASGSDIYYYFEDNNDPAMPTNSNESFYDIKYMGDTHQTTDQHKFGKGSMLIAEKKNQRDVNIGGLEGSAQGLDGEIHKMTITAWVRPAAVKNFTVLSRLPAVPGAFTLVYSSNNKCFYFQFVKSDGSRQSFASGKIPFIEPQEWMHAGLTFNEGKIMFYANGLPIGDADAAALGVTSISAAQGKQKFVMFNDLVPESYVDDFGFLADRALTEPEMDKVFNKGLEDFLKSPVPKK
ncbi:MAG: LamG-like jellyroll fold domain-containing protein [Chthoniobacterales bacterium]